MTVTGKMQNRLTPLLSLLVGRGLGMWIPTLPTITRWLSVVGPAGEVAFDRIALGLRGGWLETQANSKRFGGFSRSREPKLGRGFQGPALTCIFTPVKTSPSIGNFAFHSPPRTAQFLIARFACFCPGRRPIAARSVGSSIPCLRYVPYLSIAYNECVNDCAIENHRSPLFMHPRPL